MPSTMETPENAKQIALFKREVVSACPSLVTLSDKWVARHIPNSVFASVFDNVFNGDIKLARDILYNRYENLDFAEAENEIKNISTIPLAGNYLADALEHRQPILLISDVDNDGSLAQALAMESKRITGVPMSIQARDYDPANHGFGIDQIESWIIDKDVDINSPFTVLVADLGTNQRDTQEVFLERYPNGRLIIADHHTPTAELKVMEEHPRSWLVSPFVKGNMTLAMKGGGGVSGGYLLYTVLKHSLNTMRERNALVVPRSEFDERLLCMNEMAKASNLLDGVKCDIRLKPILENDVSKAFQVSSLTNLGRSVGTWIRPEQKGYIQALHNIVGEEGITAFEKHRMGMLQQNHYARALFEVLPELFNETPPEQDIALTASVTMKSLDIESSMDVNYIELLRPYVFNFNYENQLPAKLKGRWLGLAERCLRETGRLEKSIIESIRDFSLVKEISDDYVLITQASTPAVNKVFTGRQLAKAYTSLSKPINMVVQSVRGSQVILSVKSELPFNEVLSNVMPNLPFIKSEFKGHANVGGLTLNANNNMDPEQVLEFFSKFTNAEAKSLQDLKVIDNALEVKSIHLSLVKEILEKMRVHLEPSYAPTLLMRVGENTTFEDKYTTEKLPVSKLVERKSWEVTSEPLDFAMTASLMIPNQALKAVANDNFGGALGITLLPTGNYMVTKTVTEKQLLVMEPAVLVTPMEREREALAKEYEKRFMSKALPIVDVPRQAAIEALKFTANGSEVFHNTEAVILGLLDKTGADSHVVLDVEADGAGNAQCINVGMAIYQRVKGSGTTVDKSQFIQLIEKRTSSINNYRNLDDDRVIFNEELSLQLVSQIIGVDGGMPIRISIKVQNLTNMDQDMIDKLGMTAEKAQNNLVEILKGVGKFSISAHNLPYDNNIMRVNYPSVYEIMQEAIHLDTAVPAKNYQIAYSNMLVNKIGGDEFFNAEHAGFNLNTLLAKGEDFDYPSIKGNSILKVRGESVQIFNMKSRITTTLPQTVEDLKATLRPQMAPMQYPKYGIQKLMAMSTIHDMIRHQPVKEIVKSDFSGMGDLILHDELWDHFQENYAYDLSIGDNINKFKVFPEIAEFAKQSIQVNSLKDIDDMFLQGRLLESGSRFKFKEVVIKPGKEPTAKNKADMASQARALSTFTGEDILKANAVNYVKNNPENSERYALAWVYELVLDNYEATEQNLPEGVIKGLSATTGVEPNIIKKVYSDMFLYKKFRNIESCRVHEIHSNVGLDGDVFQEMNVFAHMLTNKARNPYLKGALAYQAGISPVAPMVDILSKQAAASTLRQVVRDVSNIVLDSDDLNNYSAKQLDNFSDEGVSIKNSRGGVAKMKSRTMSKSGDEFHIELPSIDAAAYRDMPEDDRKELDRKLEMAVTTILLANSRGAKALDAQGESLLTDIATSEQLVANLADVKDTFGVLVPTQREAVLKKIMKQCIDAILGDSTLKLSVNKELSQKDLDMTLEALKFGIEELQTGQGFDSFISAEQLATEFDVMKGEYIAMQLARETGEKVLEVPGYEPLRTPAKSAQTTMLNARNNALQVHVNMCPDLALNISNKKTDPLEFMLHSEISSLLMSSSEDNKLTNDLSPKVDSTVLASALRR